MSEHQGSVVVQAPLQQVYAFFSHFNDFPKFMSFIKEVTYDDEQRSHWVAQIVGTHEWDAINEDWIPNQQIGWRSTNGLENKGRVRFAAVDASRTRVSVYISYTPPAGVVGKIVNSLGVNIRFEEVLQHDLENFARMVEEAPAGALDPMDSHYLFHQGSSVAKNEITAQQKASMNADPMMDQQALQSRQGSIQQEEQLRQRRRQQEEAEHQRQRERTAQAAQEQAEALRRQAEKDTASRANEPAETTAQPELDPVHDTIGGRNASMDRTALGDKDGRMERFPQHHEDPMLTRRPKKNTSVNTQSAADIETESPWRNNIYGTDAARDPNRLPAEEDLPQEK
ncbi:SRPBCC family protein [Dictyobacter arantiisoli]|uniref:Coenzyme Q-binding protein COQ10 START domain-containing protein n=1 Tax=Dictyobacter arantiisoli TaxID=2014874 RepID=A0A5A5T8T3_9CHLR|nr:SRPBCC family protein [Dictyobacter arantiisoli]GCF07808.1 hypothetical protein KDI_13720 [Dictyobacter arantiisoli]